MKYWITSKHESNIPSAWCVPTFLFCQILTHIRLNVQRHGTTLVLDTIQITASRFLMQRFVMTHKNHTRTYNTNCVLCVYRPPTGNFSYFLSSLEAILNQLYTNYINIIICGDISINYLNNTNNKHQLDSLLASYILYSIVDFPTRINNCSSTAIDNIFID